MIMKLTAVVLLAAGLLSSQERFNLKVRNYFFAGFAGDTASLEKGMKICEDILAAEPKHPKHWFGTVLDYSSNPVKRSKRPTSKQAQSCGSAV